MSRIDHTDLTGHQLEMLIAVIEEGSITGAAGLLGVTQSAVSHSLEKLRELVGDPLFLRSGRGIVATARAEALAPQARALLEAMRSFSMVGSFDPARCEGRITIAANDLQREVLLPAVLERLLRAAPKLSLRVIPSNVPTAEMLRDGRCQAVISPRPPDAADLMQKRLFEDHWVVWFDPTRRAAPADLDAYLAAEHATVVYEPQRSLDFDHLVLERGIRRRFVVSVPGFAGLAGFVRGTDRLTTAPQLLRGTTMHGLQSAALPFDAAPLPMYLVWHARHQADPMHQWLRRTIEAAVPSALAATAA
jgi:DNA-binding transcriptional LysR family regulator